MKIDIKEWWGDLWRYTTPFSEIRDCYYNTRNFLFRRHDLIRTGLSKTQWWDTDSKMLYGMMGLVVDLVEKEKWIEHIDFEGSGPEWVNAKKEIEEIYAWWNAREEKEKAEEDALDAWHDYAFGEADKKWVRKISHDKNGNVTISSELKSVGWADDFSGHFNRCKHDEKSEALNKELETLKEEFEKEETEMLIRLIKVRKYLWT